MRVDGVGLRQVAKTVAVMGAWGLGVSMLLGCVAGGGSGMGGGGMGGGYMSGGYMWPGGLVLVLVVVLVVVLLRRR
jgi:hypothetical protein